MELGLPFYTKEYIISIHAIVTRVEEMTTNIEITPVPKAKKHNGYTKHWIITNNGNQIGNMAFTSASKGNKMTFTITLNEEEEIFVDKTLFSHTKVESEYELIAKARESLVDLYKERDKLTSEERQAQKY